MSSSQQPLISVLIPAYNARHTIARAIGSALRQTYQPLEVVVADDGSDDGTLEFVQRRFPEVLTCSGPNRGPNEARNRAARLATGEVFAFLDADDEMAPTRVERQWAALQSRPDLGGLCCGVVKIYGRRLVRGDREYLTGDIVVPTFLDIALQRCGHMGASFVSRREVFEAFGGFDPTPKEKELYLRMAAADQPAGRLNLPLYLVNIGMGTFRTSLARVYQSELDILARWDPQTAKDSPLSSEEHDAVCWHHHLDFARRSIHAGDRETALRCLEAARAVAERTARRLPPWMAAIEGPLWGAASSMGRTGVRLRESLVLLRTRWRQRHVRRRMAELAVEWPRLGTEESHAED